MPARPFFSIVIPTRNRSALLEYALTSVLRQTDTDYEVIVSDNLSSDDTPEVARRLGEEREVKVIQPPRPLAMAEHWNFAASHAKGEWLLLLGDDDFFSRELLASVRSAAEDPDTTVITWHSAFYHHNVEIPASERKYVPFGFNPTKINQLDVMSWTGRTYALPARRQLEKLYAFEDIVAPSGHVSALRRDVVERVEAWAGSLFHSPYPDFGCSAAVLATTDTMTFVDVPLHVLGRVPRLGRFSYLLSPEKQTDFSEALAAEYGVDSLFVGQPIQSPRLIMTNIAATLERVRRLMPSPAHEVEFDWERYFVKCQGEITAMTEAGVDTSDLVVLYEQALENQPPALQKAVRSTLRGRFPAVAHRVQWLKASPAAHRLRRLLYERQRSSPKFPDRADLRRWRSTFDGSTAGFDNISEAADYVDRLRTNSALLASPAAAG